MLKVWLLLCLSIPVWAQDWPEFRGPGGQGHSAERGLPVTWSETQNVKWKVALPGKGWSSPAIQGERIWLTTATEEGKSLRVLCVDAKTGALLLNLELFRLKSPGALNAKNSLASPTPVLEPISFTSMKRMAMCWPTRIVDMDAWAACSMETGATTR